MSLSSTFIHPPLLLYPRLFLRKEHLSVPACALDPVSSYLLCTWLLASSFLFFRFKAPFFLGFLLSACRSAQVLPYKTATTTKSPLTPFIPSREFSNFLFTFRVIEISRLTHDLFFMTSRLSIPVAFIHLSPLTVPAALGSTDNLPYPHPFLDSLPLISLKLPRLCSPPLSLTSFSCSSCINMWVLPWSLPSVPIMLSLSSALGSPQPHCCLQMVSKSVSWVQTSGT